MRFSSHVLFVVAGVGSALLFLPACQSQFYAGCQKAVDCRGGSDADVDACIEEYRGAENAADAYECDSAFDKLFACGEQHATCGAGTKIYSDDHACDTQRAALESCKRLASAVFK